MKDSIMEFLNLCSLDLFTTVLFGSHLSSSSSNDTDNGFDHDLFRKSAVRASSESIKLKRDPLEGFLYKALGMMTTRHKQFRADADKVFKIGMQMLRTFQWDLEAGTLGESR
ncbi:expressed unknown protein [Seminavis robusta]|uniref:Uncharacterized protein n=1 Tax=Seminavis robusta TaxID=568900 RepID=A0A9N8HGC6_9STRA|nr:expressed unknown protein [Seminavis robusta]|eukprot:Sro477_g150880.1 n/a (112) ;mRNA; r:55586-55921